MGFCGKNGRGVFEELGCEDDIDFVVGTFSKSVGTVGGFCVSNHPKFDVLRLVCRPYVFPASLPPSVVATAAVSSRKLIHAGAKARKSVVSRQSVSVRVDLGCRSVFIKKTK